MNPNQMSSLAPKVCGWFQQIYEEPLAQEVQIQSVHCMQVYVLIIEVNF